MNRVRGYLWDLVVIIVLTEVLAYLGAPFIQAFQVSLTWLIFDRVRDLEAKIP